jgi:hypothetical protein
MKKFSGLFFCVLALAGCSDPSSRIRGEVLAGCIKSGNSKSLCFCAFDKLEAEYGDQLTNSAPSQLLSSFARSLQECHTGQTSLSASEGAASKALEEAFDRSATRPVTLATDAREADAHVAVGSVAQQALNAAINDQVHIRTRYGGGNEYRDGRKIIETDVNGDASPDAIVLYTIEGAGAGNAVVQTLALFFENHGNYSAQDSAIVDGATDIALSNDGTVIVTSLMHGPDDPDCCPTIESTTQYRIEGTQRLPR